MDDLYVLARAVLLDAIDALGAHRNAVTLVGAQAIYLHVGMSEFAVAPYTIDGDLVIDPDILATKPPLEEALAHAGFKPRTEESVGNWVALRRLTAGPQVEVAVDLLVPASLMPSSGRRGARLPGHDMRAVRLVTGLEGALVDAETMCLASLDEADNREFHIRVAGPAALIVSKLHKIADRRGTSRQQDKDAIDVFRLLRAVRCEELARRFRKLLADSRSESCTRFGLDLLLKHFGDHRSVGTRMLIRGLGPLADANEIGLSCELLTNELMQMLMWRPAERLLAAERWEEVFGD